jgi:transposase
MGKHFGEIIIQDVLKMRNEGMTNRQIGERLGLSLKQIKNLLGRFRENDRKHSLGILPRLKGRPRKLPQTQEAIMRLENKQLKMENELLRDFLLATGRK